MADPWAQFKDADAAPAGPDRWAQFQDAAPGILEDTAKSFGVGLARGAIGLAGLPGDIEALVQTGWNKIAPQALKVTGKEVGGIKPATSRDIQAAIEPATGEFYEPRTTAGKYARTVGEFAPGALFPGGAAQRVGMNWLAPAVASEAAGQATEGTGYETAARIGAAVAAPMVAQRAARAVTPFPATSAERTRLAGVLDDEGIPVTAGQRTGNRTLQMGESTFGEMPFAGGRSRAIQEGQGEAFTSAVLRRAGETADRATPDVVNRAFERIGGQFDDLMANNRLRLDQQLHGDLTRVFVEYNQAVPPTLRSPIIAGTFEDIRNGWANTGGRVGAPGIMDGDVYQRLRSRLGDIARNTNDDYLSFTLNRIRGALDDAMARGMSPADAEAWNEARRQYRNLLVVERAAAGPGAGAGLLSPAQVRQGVVAQNKRDYVRGEGDFNDLVHAADEIMKPLPNSGTPARLAWTTVPSAMGGAGGAVLGGQGGAAAGMVAGAVAPGITGRVMMSPPVQAYLGNQAIAAPLRELDAAAAATAQVPSVAREAAEDLVPVRVKTFEDALRLKRGTRFIDPNGIERIR